MSTFETLKGMIVKQMKVNPDTVTESSRLVEERHGHDYGRGRHVRHHGRG